MKLPHSTIWPLATLLAVALGPAAIPGSPQGGAAKVGTVERFKLHGKALEGNLEGDSADRDVSVFLPPGYKTETSRRYPVLYLLHGFTDSDAKFFGLEKHWMNLPDTLNAALAGGESREMIVVMPNALTVYGGSMYSNSAATGDWEDFVSSELVAYMDTHYRTLPQTASRGLAGHSMGGYGALRIGMKHPEVFSSIYLLSPCCLAPNSMPEQAGAAFAERLAAIKSPADVAQADFMTKAMFASAAAWSPDPKNPPFYVDLPWKDGKIQPLVAAKWNANAPLAMIDQYIPNLKRLHAIAFDAGTEDRQIAATIRTLDQILSSYGIAHTYETYEGTHTSHVADRMEKKMMPFFSKNLAFGPAGSE